MLFQKRTQSTFRNSLVGTVNGLRARLLDVGLSFLRISRKAHTHTASYLTRIGDSFSVVKRLGCEADQSPPCSEKVKNKWSCTSTPQCTIMEFTGINLSLFTQPYLTCLLRQSDVHVQNIGRSPLTSWRVVKILFVYHKIIFSFRSYHAWLMNFFPKRQQSVSCPRNLHLGFDTECSLPWLTAKLTAERWLWF
jgi:hypothetical protein